MIDPFTGQENLYDYFRCECGIRGSHTAHATQVSMFDEPLPEKPKERTMQKKAKQDHIYVVIERKVIAAEGLCDDCKAHGCASRWAMVRRYIVPPDTPYDKLFGIGDGSIEPKGPPDNMSTGAVEFLQVIRGEARQQGMKIGAWTSSTQKALAQPILGVDAWIADMDSGSDGCWGLVEDWHDPTPPTPYRIVAWRVGMLPVVEKGVSDES